jgi:hypothetical protein
MRFGLDWFMVFNTTFNNIPVISWWSVLLVEETGVPRENKQHSSHIVVVSFIGGGNWSTLRKQTTCHNSLTNFYHIMLYQVHLCID